MNKNEYIKRLKSRLRRCPEAERERFLAYYAEMIDDRIEEGFTEEAACESLGSVNEIAAQIIDEISKDTPRAKKEIHILPIVLLILGFPLWLPLLIAAFAVLLSLFICLWCVIGSLWIAFASVAISVPIGIAAAIIAIFAAGAAEVLVDIGAALILAGIAVFMFWFLLLITKLAAKGTVGIFKIIGHVFVR